MRFKDHHPATFRALRRACPFARGHEVVRFGGSRDDGAAARNASSPPRFTAQSKTQENHCYGGRVEQNKKTKKKAAFLPSLHNNSITNKQTNKQTVGAALRARRGVRGTPQSVEVSRLFRHPPRSEPTVGAVVCGVARASRARGRVRRGRDERRRADGRAPLGGRVGRVLAPLQG